MPAIDYPFTEAELQAAAAEWNCSCGPAALAFTLQVPLAEVRGKIPGFEERGYVSPTMMKAGLANLGRTVKPYPFLAFVAGWFTPQPSLVRIQFTGPWTAPGANPKWAYNHTHWIAVWRIAAWPKPGSLQPHPDATLVFDCNSGVLTYDRWKNEVVPVLTAAIKRADGGFHATHVWRIEAGE